MAAQYLGEWYRACVTSVVGASGDTDACAVHYLDYGNDEDSVSRGDMRELLGDFCQLPILVRLRS